MEIKLEHVSKYYQDNDKSTKGIEDISLSFQTDGSFVVITGESGSGKTTLIKILTGLEDFDEGEIYFDGMDASDFSDKERLEFYRNNISFVFQDYNLVESFSAEENIVLALIKQGVDKKEAKKKAAEVLERVGLRKQKKMRTSKLSGGERQRVAIARSIALDTKVIIFDEPTGNLDQERSKQIIELISSLCKDRLILYVTHEYQQVLDVVTRHVVLADGSVIKDEIVREPNIQKEEKSGLNKSNRFSFRNYLYAASRFAFRRPGRFIATVIVLFITAWAFFGTSLLCAGSIGLVSITYTTSGFGVGNTVLVKKNEISDSKIEDEDGVVDTGDYLNQLYRDDIYLNLESDIQSFDGYSNGQLGDYGLSINNSLPEKYEIGKISDNPSDDGVYIVLYSALESATTYKDYFKPAVGKYAYISPFSPLESKIQTVDAVKEAFLSFPKVKINGVYFSDEDSVYNTLSYLYAPTNVLQKVYDLVYQDYKGTDLHKSEGSISYAYSVMADNKELNKSTSADDDLSSSHFLFNSKWKDEDIVLSFSSYTLPLKESKYIAYDDSVSTYSYHVYGDPIGRIIEEYDLYARIYYPDAKTAETKAKELSQSYQIEYDGPYQRTHYQVATISSMNAILRFLFLLLYVFLVGLLFLVVFLVKNILNKFYYRKDNDQMVLSYIGYSKKDMLFINLFQFLSLSILFMAVINIVMVLLESYVKSLFMLLPGFFIFAIVLDLLFSVYLALPSRKRVR